MLEQYTLIVSKDHIGERLDKFIKNELDAIGVDMSRNRVQELVKHNFTLKESYKVKENEEYILKIPKPKKYEISANEDIKLDIVYEDEHLLVINKQHGLITHPCPNHYEDTLVNALLSHCKDSLSGINGVERPGIVHRLDKDTSGLMLVAKNDKAHNSLAKQIQDKTLKRCYLALIYGVPKTIQSVVNKNIDRSKTNRTKMCIVHHGGKHALTHYTVKEVLCNGLFSLVECELKTGRTHQIRIHMLSIGHGIVGDKLYFSKGMNSMINAALKDILSTIDRQSLHSYKVEFMHPFNDKLMKFEVDLPDDVKNLYKKLKIIQF